MTVEEKAKEYSNSEGIYNEHGERLLYMGYLAGYKEATRWREQAQKDAYNEAIDDAVNSVKVVNTKRLNFENGKWENIPLIDQTSILKLKK